MLEQNKKTVSVWKNQYGYYTTTDDVITSVYGINDEGFEANAKLSANGNKYVVCTVVEKTSLKTGKKYFKVV